MKHFDGSRGETRPHLALPRRARFSMPRVRSLLGAAALALVAAGLLGPGAGPAQGRQVAVGQGVQVAASAAMADPPAGPVPTAYFREIWGEVTLDGAPAPVGTVVRALSPRGEVAGSATVVQPGRLGYMRIYGEDFVLGRTLPGMRAGETPLFTINGRPATPSLQGPAEWRDSRRPDRLDLSATTR